MAWTRKVVLQRVCQPDRHAWLQVIERTGSCGSKMSTSLALRESCRWLSDFARRLTLLSALLISIGLVHMTVDHARDNFATSLGTILRGIRRCAKTLNSFRAPGTARPPALAKFEQVAALNWTWTPLAGGGASRFPFRGTPLALRSREPAIPDVTQGRAHRHVGGPEVP